MTIKKIISACAITIILLQPGFGQTITSPGGTGSGGGAVTVADGADITQGAISDAASSAGGTGSLSAKLRLMTSQLSSIITNTGSAIPAGSAIVGKVGIDQTTPGTTNNVAVSYGANALVDNPCQTVAQTSTPISISTNTTTRIIAPTAAKKTYICALSIQAAAADNVGVVEGTGGTCGAGTAGVYGGATAASGLNLAANQGFAWGNGESAVMQTAGSNVDFCLITSASTNLAGHVRWVQK